ncbi:MAG: Gfo/Idh/MocA family oxidoreductase [Cyclobacteriaceae bacterium]|nr:Gfo/Idh/MocA family oxidoreductase [Cyclobacteriaceae bacterium]
MQRRDFIKVSGAAGLAGMTFPNIILASKTKKMTLALIGTGWWGMNILREAMAEGSSKIVALCDPDRKAMETAAEEVQKLSGDKAKLYTDYRELLKKEKPDIVIIATPDHWHALQGIESLKAGCHIYLEKPISHTIDEGKALVAASEKYGKKIQVGLHRHISPHNMSGIDFLRSGKAGKIGFVRAFVHYGGSGRRAAPPSEVPSHLDWNMWCGPAPLLPFSNDIHPRGFRNYMDYTTGMVGDWGVHWFDQILWWSEDKHPKRVFSTGNQFFKGGPGDAPDFQTAVFEFEEFTVNWEHRRFAANESEKHSIGVYFYGTEGVFHLGWQDGWTFYPAKKDSQIIHQKPSLGMPDHQNIKELWADFIQAIRNNQKPVADIVNSQYATNMSLLAVLSMQAGRSIEWNGEKQEIVGDAEATRRMRRDYRSPWIYPDASNI